MTLRILAQRTCVNGHPCHLSAAKSSDGELLTAKILRTTAKNLALAFASFLSTLAFASFLSTRLLPSNATRPPFRRPPFITYAAC